MNKPDKTHIRMMSEAYSMAKGMYDAGLIDLKRFRYYEAETLPALSPFSPTRIKKIRLGQKMSQPVFAVILNVSVACIKQWERGERKPSGAALRLLDIIARKGVEAIL